MRDVAIADGALDTAGALEAFAAASPEAGAIVTFIGRVRGGAGVEALELTHYEPLTLSGMEALADEASGRWKLDGILIRHRVGTMVPGNPIVLVATSSAHRRDAYEANDFLMDHLKSAAWFWKREKRADGWHWILPRGQDHDDRARWEKSAAV